MESKEQESKLTKVVAAVIFSDDRGSVLLGKRARGKPFPNKWEFIGGKVEKEESLEDAIERETFEETSLGIVPISPIGEAKFDTPDGLFDVTFFECEVKYRGLGDIVRDPKVHSKFDWVKIKDLTKLDWVGANLEFAKWFVEYNKNKL